MKIILIDESYPLNTRNSKILTSLAQAFPQAEMHILTWDRSGCFDGGMAGWHYHLYDRPASYGNKLQKLLGLGGYRKFCQAVIRQLQPDVIIASHWNNLLMLPRVDYHRQMVIYENLDAPTGPWLGRRLLGMIEHHYMKRIALTVHASRFYEEIYPHRYPQLVLENKPTLQTVATDYHPASPLNVVYLGIIRYIDILKNLVDAARDNDQIRLSFHGSGPDLQTLLDYTQGMPNVVCTGAYRYEDIGRLYDEADVIWAAYPNRDFNVRYAISNKFHESIAYGRPAIYADHTRLGQYAAEHHLGYEVDPYSPSSIRSLLDILSKDPAQLRDTHTALCTHKQTESTWNQDVEQLIAHIRQFHKV